MSSFILKIIAIVAMIIDHSNDAIIGHYTFLNAIGRISFPIFAFQLTVGYKHTNDRKKYIERMFLFAIVSQIPFSLFMNALSPDFKYNLNVFFTLVCGSISMFILDYKNQKIKKYILNTLKTVIITLLVLLTQFTNMDHGGVGTLFIVLTYIFYDKNKLIYSLCYVIMVLARYIPYFLIGEHLIPYITMTIMSTIPLFLTLLYNNKKGPGLKYFFYLFYPVHLIILDIIHYWILK